MKNLIYALVDPRTGQPRYIGLSTRGLDRPKVHARPANLAATRTYCRNWLKQLTDAGLHPKIQVLEYVEDRSDLPLIEQFWIAQGRGLGWPLTNLAKGGEGPIGVVRSPETRKRLSAAQQRRWLRPEEHAKISAALTGKRASAETKQRMARSHAGRSPSEETRRLLSERQKGRVFSPEHLEKLRTARRLRAEREKT